MPSLKYYLPKGAGPKLIELSISGDDLVVFLDGREVGTTPRKNHVKEFLLEDANRIDVGPFGLEVRWNGRLVDSTGEPVLAWKVGKYLLLAFAFIGFWNGYNNLANEIEWFGFMQLGWGLLFLVLGVLVWRRSRTALLIATWVYVISHGASLCAYLVDEGMSWRWALSLGVLFFNYGALRYALRGLDTVNDNPAYLEN